VVCSGPIHFPAAATAPEVSATYYDSDLGSQVIDFFDARTDSMDGIMIQSGFLAARQSLAAELDKHALIHDLSLPISFVLKSRQMPKLFYSQIYYLLFYRK